MLAGRLPSAPGEIVIDPGIQERFAELGVDTEVGGDLPWGATTLRLVGLVEDPNATNAEIFLVAPGSIVDPQATQIVINATEEQFNAFARRWPILGWESFAESDRAQQLSMVVVFALATVALAVIGLLCSTGFYVMHSRHARQYAILASLGATESQMRRAMTAIGAITGLVGSLVGSAVAVAGFVLARPWLETVFHHDIPLGSVAFWAVVPSAVIATSTTTLAALAPARVTARASIRSVLQASAPKSIVVPTVVAALLISVGVVGLRTGGLLTVPAGAAALIAGTLSLLPAVAALIRTATQTVGVLWRIVGADLVRHRSKTVTSLGALTIVAAIAMTAGLAGAAHDRHAAEQPPNLPPTMALVTANGPDPTPGGGEIGIDAEQVGRLAAAVPDATVVPILGVFEPDRPAGVYVSQQVADLIVEGDIVVNEYTSWLATPELLEAFDLDPALATSEATVLARIVSPVALDGWSLSTNNRTDPEPLPMPAYESIAPAWITVAAATDSGYRTEPIGYLIDSPSPMTTDQVNRMYSAAGTKLSVTPYIDDPTPAPVGSYALVGGSVLSVLMASALVALIRTESARDNATLYAVGAAPRTSKSLIARTSLILLLASGVLGAPIAYVLLQAIVNASGTFPATISPAIFVAYLVVVPVIGAAISTITDRSPQLIHRQLLD